MLSCDLSGDWAVVGQADLRCLCVLLCHLWVTRSTFWDWSDWNVHTSNLEVTETQSLCLSCPGVSDVAVRPTERCTAPFRTAPPLIVSTPPTKPTTAAPSVRLVSRVTTWEWGKPRTWELGLRMGVSMVMAGLQYITFRCNIHNRIIQLLDRCGEKSETL